MGTNIQSVTITFDGHWFHGQAYVLSLISFVDNQDTISSLFEFYQIHAPLLTAINNGTALS